MAPPSRDGAISLPLYWAAVLALVTVTFIAAVAQPAGAPSPLGSSAADYPICPFTGKPPTKPNVTMTRCPGAQNFSCCPDCYDRYVALQAVSANSSLVINTVAPGLGTVLASEGLVQLCGAFAGFPECQLVLEEAGCGLHCYPGMGNYVRVDKGTPEKPKLATYRFCKSFVERAYRSCSAVSIPGSVTLGDIFPDARSFFETAFAEIIAAYEVYNLNVEIDTSSDTSRCFTGAPGGIVPEAPGCCDPLRADSECPDSKLGVPKNPSFLPFIGRKLDPRVCSKYEHPPPPASPTSSAPPPPPSPSASTPSPPKAAHPQAPGWLRTCGGVLVAAGAAAILSSLAM